MAVSDSAALLAAVQALTAQVANLSGEMSTLKRNQLAGAASGGGAAKSGKARAPQLHTNLSKDMLTKLFEAGVLTSVVINAEHKSVVVEDSPALDVAYTDAESLYEAVQSVMDSSNTGNRMAIGAIIASSLPAETKKAAQQFIINLRETTAVTSTASTSVPRPTTSNGRAAAPGHKIVSLIASIVHIFTEGMNPDAKSLWQKSITDAALAVYADLVKNNPTEVANKNLRETPSASTNFVLHTRCILNACGRYGTPKQQAAYKSLLDLITAQLLAKSAEPKWWESKTNYKAIYEWTRSSGAEDIIFDLLGVDLGDAGDEEEEELEEPPAPVTVSAPAPRRAVLHRK